MSSNSRASMVCSAAALFGSRGLSATSFSDVLADSGAPRGSIYHHFPGGKKQLAQDAIGWTSEQILTHLRACPADTAAGVLAWFIDLWRQSVQVSGGSAGCPVAGIAIDTVAADDLIDAARAAFAQWTALLASQLQAAGVPTHRAGPIATTSLAAMEGALILCRAERSGEPLETTAQELMSLLPGPALASAQRRRSSRFAVSSRARRVLHDRGLMACPVRVTEHSLV
jgi:TetR/AcrR family transcriptional regulator, lmrAB and yxaGH operons repressor